MVGHNDWNVYTWLSITLFVVTEEKRKERVNRKKQTKSKIIDFLIIICGFHDVAFWAV